LEVQKGLALFRREVFLGAEGSKGFFFFYSPKPDELVVDVIAVRNGANSCQAK
jgi:hypothetical protein